MATYNESWWQEAACRGSNPDLFYPVGNASKEARQQIADAKAVCASCPVIDLCLSEALSNNEQGIWGGTTEEERAAIIKHNRSSANKSDCA